MTYRVVSRASAFVAAMTAVACLPKSGSDLKIDAGDADAFGSQPDPVDPSVFDDAAGTVSVKSAMDFYLEEKRLAGCAGAPTTSWNALLQGLGINPFVCDVRAAAASQPTSPYFLLRIIGNQNDPDPSGVVVKDGIRDLYQITLTSCDQKPYVFRFTYDMAPTLCGYELFVNSSDGIDAFAIADDGNRLAEVPRELAYDKHYNKKDLTDDIVRQGTGCFECHPEVSSNYSMPGYAEFWAAAKANVERLLNGTAGSAGDQRPGEVDPLSPNFGPSVQNEDFSQLGEPEPITDLPF